MTSPWLFELDKTKCECGYRLNQEMSDLREDMLREISPVFDQDVQDEKVVECPNCKMKHKLSLSLEVQISVIDYSMKCIQLPYYDKGDNRLAVDYFNNLRVADTVYLEDGDYVAGDYVYHIEKEKVDYIASSIVDENQMNLFEYEQVAI